MPIDLGLKRIAQLLSVLGNPQQCYNSVHVAGTNGKGSICSYISSILTKSHVRNGKFTSPHLVRRSDCIMIDEVPVDHGEFLHEEERILSVNQKHNLQCTEFEILTCTAFELFKKKQVELAIIEVGLGGRLDATNVLEPLLECSKGVIATVISKIGLDHEGILGSSLAEIAAEKAGIMKHKVPCVADGTNSPESISLFKAKAESVQLPLHLIEKPESFENKWGSIKDFNIPLLGSYQYANLSLALKVSEILSGIYPQITPQSVHEGVSSVRWPGRLQHLDLKYNADKPSAKILLDGAHNGSAAIELSKYIRENIRKDSVDGVTFIIAITQGKTLEPLIQPLISAKDTVIVTRFSDVDGMPWIHCNEPTELLTQLHKYTDKVIVQNDLPEALARATEISGDQEIVVCGSLYLVGDILRLHSLL